MRLFLNIDFCLPFSWDKLEEHYIYFWQLLKNDRAYDKKLSNV